jgi:RNA polymerase sigma-70 factor (ECF subfamily)
LNLKIDDIDNSLIDQLQNGNKNAFKMLFDKYGTRLYQFSLKYLRDKEDTEDLLNEVFMKIWENRHNLKTNTSFHSYLFTIAYNNIRQRFLKKSREEKYIQTFAKENLVDSSDVEDQVDYILLVQKINKIIDLLPTRRKEIFELSYKAELKNREIADKLSLSEQFVKNQLSIARKYIIGNIKQDKPFACILLFYLFASQNLD